MGCKVLSRSRLAAGAARACLRDRAGARRAGRAGDRRRRRPQERDGLCGAARRRHRSRDRRARRGAERPDRALAGSCMCGPNCMGFNALREKNFGYPNGDLCALTPGSVAFVTQSGGTVQYIGSMGAHRGVNFNYLISSGNELSVDLADYVNYLRRGRRHARDRAVRRGHPPSAGVHGGGREGAGRRQADHRDQDRQVAEGARQRAVAHRRHRRRLRRLHRDVRALRHRRLPDARRHDRDAAGVPGRPPAEGPARRLDDDLGRHRRSPVRLSRGDRRDRDAGIQRRHQGGAAPAGLVRARVEEPARRRQSGQRRA